jgi:hypothetical protein
MGNDLEAYRAQIGGFYGTSSKKCSDISDNGVDNMDKNFSLGILVLLYTSLNNIAFFLIVSLYILAMCVDVHPHPGPPTQATNNLTMCNFNIHSIKVFMRFDLIKEKIANLPFSYKCVYLSV